MSLDGFEYRVRNDGGSSNPVLIGFATRPGGPDNETTARPTSAQESACRARSPAGSRNADRDWYVFNAKKGDVFNIEVLSERLARHGHVLPGAQHRPTRQDMLNSSRRTMPRRFR